MVSASSIRFQLLLSTAIAASLAIPSAASAQNLPVKAPDPRITTSGDGHTMNVDLPNQREIINWQSFDIANGYTVDFHGTYVGGGNQAVLNRVTGDPATGIIDPSDINGALNSDSFVEVFLINTAGILFGNGASVDVGSLIASTLNITDANFLSGGSVDPSEPGNPNLYYFFDAALGSESTGITVANGAEVNTNSGPLTLLGGFIDVQTGGSVTAATDLGLVAANRIRVPADPGSRISFSILRPTPREDAITVGGQISGENVTAFMETSDSAENALLLITESGSITATKDTGGDIVLNIAARTEGDTIADSPGGIRNDGDLNATDDVVFAGSISNGVTYRPRFVENNGTITAGDDVFMEAWQDITNAGTINAGGDVTLSAIATGYSTAPALHVSNSGTITADGDVSLNAHANVSPGSTIVLLAAIEPAFVTNADVKVTNTGTINAGGNVTLNGSISVSNFSSNTITLDPAVQVLNDGTINADGNVTLVGSIDVFGMDGSTVAVAADVNVINDGPITAGGDVNLTGTIDIFTLEGTDGGVADQVIVTPTIEVTNSGKISADGDVNFDGEINVFNVNALDITAAASMQMGNDSTIAAAGDVNFDASIDLFNMARSSGASFGEAAFDIVAGANLQLTNSGSISAAGDIDISAEIDMFNLNASELAANATMDIVNGKTISAGGDVDIAATIDLFNLAGSTDSFVPIAAASTITANANLDITNNGKISADGDVDISANVDLSSVAVSELNANANLSITNVGTITAGGDVDISAVVAFSSIAGSVTGSGSFTFAATSIVANADVEVTNIGTISADGDANILAAVSVSEISSTAFDMFAEVGIANSGKIIADGDAKLRATIPFVPVIADTFAFASDVHVTNGGTISAQGDVHVFASGGDVTNSGKIVGDNVFISKSTSGNTTLPFGNSNIINSGTITARGNAQLIADNNITNSGVIDTGGVALLDAGNDIDNTGSVSAVGDAILTAGGDILDSSGTFAGTISGRDVALSAVGSITAGTVTARDDIAIRAGGTVATGSLISGATIGANGPVDVDGAADDLLPGVDLTGHDVDVDGSAIAVNVIRANGAGSDIRLRKPVTSSRDDLDFFAGGNITIDGAASAVDIAMDAGGNITIDGNVSARDDIALIAGGLLDVGLLASGVTVNQQPPVDQDGSADALLGQTLLGHDLFVQASEVDLPLVTANGTNSDLTVIATTGPLNVDNGTAGGTITLTKEGATGNLTAGTLTAGTGVTLRSSTNILATTVVTASGDLDFRALGDVTVTDPLAGDDVAISAGGIINTADIRARDDIALLAGDTLNVGTLTSGVAINGTGPVDTAGAADDLVGVPLDGHDIFVRGGTVDLTQATANGTGSDLTVRATTGPLNIDNGQAGGAITLIKEGTAGILTAGTLVAGTDATLTSSTDIDATSVQAGRDLAFTAGGDVTLHSNASGRDVAIDAGGTITTGDINARDDIALRAGDTLHTGTLASGVTVNGAGPVDEAGSADALLAGQNLAGHDLFVQGGHVDLASATANGSGSDLTVRATTGDLNVTNGKADGSIDLIKEGASGTLTASTLVAGTGASLTSSTGISANNVSSSSGDIDFDALQGVSVGTVLAQAGDVNILADDLDISGGIAGSEVSITNREGGNLVTVLGDASATGAFHLTQTELNLIHAGTLSIDSLGQNLLVGNVAFADGAGSSRINLLGTGRVDIVGEISGSGSGRTLQIGGTRDAANPNDPTTLASIIRMAPMSSGGGRIIFAGGTLDLRGVKIGVGLDDGFLTPLGLVPGGSPVSTQVVQDDWVGNFNSTLYGIPGGYADPLVISAGTIIVTYTDYALFQNTGARGTSGVNADVLTIISSGADTNGFEMFGTINQVGGVGAAFLVQPTDVSLQNSRINGCLILTGGGCGSGPPGTNFTEEEFRTDRTSDAKSTNPALGGSSATGDNFAEQDLVSAGEDEAFDFDSLVGTNNEGLLGVLGVDDQSAEEPCAPDDKREICRVKERANEQ